MKAAAVWDENYKKLVNFQKDHGHCAVPRKKPYFGLAKWVIRQRNSTRLSESQVSRLKEIGFSWETKQERDDKAWDQRFKDLMRYKMKHGDCRVPQLYKEDVELGTWVANQRKRHNKNKLRQDRKAKLIEVGFKWSVKESPKARGKQVNSVKRDAHWNNMFRKLESYKEKHGDCNVPYMYEQDPSLAMWVSTQRREFHQKTWYGKEKEIFSDRMEKLNSIGFQWTMKGSKKERSAFETKPEADCPIYFIDV